MEIKDYMQTVGRQACAASRRLAMASTAEKNAALSPSPPPSAAKRRPLVAANGEDLAAARAAGLLEPTPRPPHPFRQGCRGMAKASNRSPGCLTRLAK